MGKRSGQAKSATVTLSAWLYTIKSAWMYESKQLTRTRIQAAATQYEHARQ